MRVIPTLPPGGHPCAVIPGRALDPEGFVDTMNTQIGVDPPVRISVAAVKEMARLIGWVPPARFHAAEADAEDLRFQLAQLSAECAQMHKELDAIDGLTKAGFVPRRAAGRPKKKTELAA